MKLLKHLCSFYFYFKTVLTQKYASYIKGYQDLYNTLYAHDLYISTYITGLALLAVQGKVWNV